jgi:NAD(P)-dependent dehydrogenase (short-subunit alcohol dehydrogenase family)
MGSFAGKSVIVLGAATPDNMGQVIARRFAAEGAAVMVAGRHDAVLADFAKAIGAAWCHCDITSGRDLDTLIERTLARFGRVDVGINASGTGLLKPFLDNTIEDLERITAIQFTGPFRFFQGLVRAMTNGGSIIQITSAVATIMLDDHAAYMGTKAGTDHVLRSIANEFGERGIRANSIAPGLTATPMAAAVFASEPMVEAYRREYPLGRIGTAEDVAEAALFLASDKCFMTGQTLQVNGGLTLRRNPRNAELKAALQAGRRN